MLGLLRLLRGLRVALLAPLRRRRVDRAIDDEFALHLELRAEDLVRRGVLPKEAIRQARIEFGGMSVMKEAAREAWGMAWTDHLARDVRYASRMLRKNPGFATIAVLSLGFGVGASTTVFSVIDALDFRPLPYAHADRLVWLAEITPPRHEVCSACAFWTSAPTARDWSAAAASFGSVAAVRSHGLTWVHEDVEEPLYGKEATPSFFDVLGARPAIGRLLTPSDTAAAAEPVAVLSYEFWQSRFGGDTHVLGSRMRTSRDGRQVTVVGVLSGGFRFREAADFWMPLRLDPSSSRTNRSLTVIARLAPGQTVASANAELKTISAQLAAEFPAAYREWGAAAEPLRTLLTVPAGEARFVLFATTMLVPLIAALNVAGLLLGRTLARQQELAMRRAIGASRGLLAGQLLIEGGCIGIAGGALGIVMAFWAMRLVPRWFSTESLGIPATLDHRVVAFAVALSVVVGAAAAAAPAIRGAAMEAGDALRRGTSSESHGRRGSRVSNVLITVQIALALVLLAAASLLSRDFLMLRYLDIGYDPAGLYSTSIAGEPSADPFTWRVVADQARTRVSSIPGVVGASLEHVNAMHPAIVRPDGGVARTDSGVTPVVKGVDANYFTTFGTPLLLGRAFGVADDRGAPLVAIVNKAAADAFWPSANPIGRRIYLGDSLTGGELTTVVGVSADMEREELVGRRHVPMVYRPFGQARIYHPAASLHLRIVSNAPMVLPAVEHTIREITNRTPRPIVSTEKRLDDSLAARRLSALALDLFAAFGLLLAAMGIYGSVAYAVTRRTREIGIRTALGAQRWTVTHLVARRGIVLAFVGVALGCTGAMAVERVLQSLMAATSSTSPWMLAGSALAMTVVVVVATFLPAARATRIDVVDALRSE